MRPGEGSDDALTSLGISQMENKTAYLYDVLHDLDPRSLIIHAPTESSECSANSFAAQSGACKHVSYLLDVHTKMSEDRQFALFTKLIKANAPLYDAILILCDAHFISSFVPHYAQMHSINTHLYPDLVITNDQCVIVRTLLSTVVVEPYTSINM